jgi:phenylpropionate dioxygenase-like ring-hydroxylating dioxygenase large terminal subunit
MTTSEIARLHELVREDRIHIDMYRNPRLFEQEMERIFGQTWVWVAHDSQLPDPGDFITTYLGLHPVIVNRDRAGTVRVMLNRCRHRGATLCEARRGNTSMFVCPYHAWSYGQDGALRGLPLPRGYKDLDKEELGLTTLRTESYAGLIFATLNPDVPSLYDFLGRARQWIDLFTKQGAGFPIRAVGEHRFTFPGNWKIQLENTTDAYHFPIVHKSFLTSLDKNTEQLYSFMNSGGFVEDLGNGHSVMVMIPELFDLEANLDAPIPERFQALAQSLRAEHSEDQVRRIVRAVGGTGFNLNLFPNLACSMAFLRVLRPLAVDQTEIRHIVLTMEGGPLEANRARLRLHEHFQGPMGFGTTDDADAWERVQRGAYAGRDGWIMINRGEDKSSENAGDVTSETGMRAAYRMWKRMMAA